MRLTLVLLSSVLLFACSKEEITTSDPTNSSNPTTGGNNTQYLGYVEFDLEEAGVTTHYEFYIDSVKQGNIQVPDGQGGFEQVLFHVGSNTRSLSFRYFDSNGDENVIDLTETLSGTTNSISISHLGSEPFVAQTNTNVPLCNTADFEIDVVSENEATFAADYLYNFYTSDVVHLTNGRYIMY
jgi:hypothetical protein